MVSGRCPARPLALDQRSPPPWRRQWRRGWNLLGVEGVDVLALGSTPGLRIDAPPGTRDHVIRHRGPAGRLSISMSAQICSRQKRRLAEQLVELSDHAAKPRDRRSFSRGWALIAEALQRGEETNKATLEIGPAIRCRDRAAPSSPPPRGRPQWIVWLSSTRQHPGVVCAVDATIVRPRLRRSGPQAAIGPSSSRSRAAIAHPTKTRVAIASSAVGGLRSCAGEGSSRPLDFPSAWRLHRTHHESRASRSQLGGLTLRRVHVLVEVATWRAVLTIALRSAPPWSSRAAAGKSPPVRPSSFNPL